MEGVGRAKALLDRFDEIIDQASPSPDDATWTSCWPSRPSCRSRSTPPTAGSSTAPLEIAMDALRCPPGDADVTTLSGGERRRVALCRLLLQARHAAARRADQPPRRRDRGLARAVPGGVQGHGGRRHPRPLLPRQRRRLDPRARSRRAASPGRATTPPGSSRSRSAWQQEEKRGPGRASARSRASWSGSARARRPGTPSRKARIAAYEELLAQSREQAPRAAARSSSRRARAWATW